MLECVICGREIKEDPRIPGWDRGHNAEPVKEGRCCDDCNSFVVIHARINDMFVENRSI